MSLYTCPQCGHYPIQENCSQCGWTEHLPTPADFESTTTPPAYSMATLSPTEFEMGSAENQRGRDPDEDPHIVRLPHTYAIGRTEVSQRLYLAITHDNPSHFIGERLPVESLTWFEACSFCNEYSRLYGYTPAYRFQKGQVLWDQSASGFRLPTEAEWENAAKKAMKNVQGTKNVWFEETSFFQTKPVGQQSGLSDMAGNVWEWCWDKYGPYLTNQTQINPIGPSNGHYRVARGGSWADKERVIRPANRASAPPTHRSNSIGFRLARTLNKTEPEA